MFDNIEQISGVYLWCIKADDNVFRVYYVGEARDIKDRLNVHLSMLLKGKYTGHHIDSLKNNVKILMHRAEEGMVPRFNNIDANEFNKELARNIFIFFAQISDIGDQNINKWNRCRFETAICMHIENSGANILSVGHLRYWKDQKSKVSLDTGASTIEYISGEVLSY